MKTDGLPAKQSLLPNDTIPTCSPLTAKGPPESPEQLPTGPLPVKILFSSVWVKSYNDNQTVR